GSNRRRGTSSSPAIPSRASRSSTWPGVLGLSSPCAGTTRRRWTRTVSTGARPALWERPRWPGMPAWRSWSSSTAVPLWNPSSRWNELSTTYRRSTTVRWCSPMSSTSSSSDRLSRKERRPETSSGSAGDRFGDPVADLGGRHPHVGPAHRLQFREDVGRRLLQAGGRCWPAEVVETQSGGEDGPHGVGPAPTGDDGSRAVHRL